MRNALLALLLLGPAGIALADGPPAAAAKAAAAKPKPPKVKTYEFSGLDVEGKLKTPQLLYFLNRMDAEFDATQPARRSFLPELRRSTTDL